MSENFLWCPACPEAVLEPVERRHHCGRCDGMFVPEDELVRAMRDVTADEIRFYAEQPGRRPCPHCRAPMTRVRLATATIAIHIGRLPFELDRCVPHGLWFDGAELQATLSNAARDSTIEAFVRAIRRLRGP